MPSKNRGNDDPVGTVLKCVLALSKSPPVGRIDALNADREGTKLDTVDPAQKPSDPAPDPAMVADAVLNKVKHFTIGFGRAGQTPSAMGSGVLIRDGDRHGILTCAHVDSYVRTLKQPIGLVRLNRGPAEKFGTLDLDEVFTSAAGEAPWNEDDEDIAFIHLRPDLVGNIAKDCTFLDIGRNFAKPQPTGLPDIGSGTLRVRAR
jgi:hypothetical protein